MSLFLSLILFSTLSCKKNDSSITTERTPYESEILVLNNVINALLEYKKETSADIDSDRIIRANKEMLVKMKKLIPQITFITETHPEWVSTPPKEVAEYVARYIEVNREFTTTTLKRVNDYVQRHFDDKELARSFSDLTAFLSPRAKSD
jgi:hypothetical protein